MAILDRMLLLGQYSGQREFHSGLSGPTPPILRMYQYRQFMRLKLIISLFGSLRGVLITFFHRVAWAELNLGILLVLLV